MTDDAMRKAFFKYIETQDTNKPEWQGYDGLLKSWQAATAVLLEKLKSEGALNAAVTNLREMDNWLTKDAEGDTIENYETIARAVIEALEKELVG